MLINETIEKWFRENLDTISLYWRGCAARFLKLNCPLCGSQLKRVKGHGSQKRRLVCTNPKCKLVAVKLHNLKVQIEIEPLTSITFTLKNPHPNKFSQREKL